MSAFIKDIIFGENSVYNKFYDEDNASNYDTLANSNFNNAHINKNVDDVESAIGHDEITIHPNSNFGNMTDANITAIKVASRVQIWKKTFCQNSDKFGYGFIKTGIMFMHLFCIYKKPIIYNLKLIHSKSP